MSIKDSIIKLMLLLLVNVAMLNRSNAQEKAATNDEILFDHYIAKNSGTPLVDINFVIVQFKNKVPSEIPIVRSLSPKTKIIAQKDIYLILKIKDEVIVDFANNDWKWSPSFTKDFKSNEAASYILSYTELAPLQNIIDKNAGKIILLQNNTSAKVALVTTSKLFLEKNILPLSSITFIDKSYKAKPEIIALGYDRSFHGINQLDFTQPLANGKGITVGIKENRFDISDLDIIKRDIASSLQSAAENSHATIIATLVGGAGNIYHTGRGIANHCNFYSSSFANLFADDASILQQKNVTVQNHSYGTVIQSFYGEEARSYDDITWNNKNFLPIFSSGNSGSGFSTTGKFSSLQGFANLTGNFKAAKNVLIVGAISGTGALENLSSQGPTYDGRIAPQIVALGPNGTSDASAIVSGTAAVLQQVFKDSNANILPSAALVKALMINTATDIGVAGIDYKSGYGVLNSGAAVLALQRKNYKEASVVSNGTYTANLTIPANSAAVKVTLCWTDSASTANNDKALINDLDLSLTQLSNGVVNLPWVLSSFANRDSLLKPATRRLDTLNTTEQVSISLPAAGNYTINVKAKNIIGDALPFSIVYTIDTLNTFRFTSPIHQIEVDKAESPFSNITWVTQVADTNTTGNLAISYNAGTTWNTVQNNVRIYKNNFSWLIPDTSALAQLRMQTNFGNFFSPTFLLHPITKMSVDFLCADSLGLSWTRNPFASSYDIFTYADSAFLKKIVTVSDTSVVLQRNIFSGNVFAVQPLLSNGIAAARSIAIDLNFEGVNCFYKTFNAFLIDDNKVNLELNLSITKYVDSIYFEKVSALGVVEKVLNGIKVNQTSFQYEAFDAPETNGILYYRGKIKLKSGIYIYTDIESLITSGKQFIVFYPNPATTNSPINLVIKDGRIADAKLVLLSSDGKILQYYDVLPSTINTILFPKGIVYFKLLDANNILLQSGQIVIVK